MVYCSLTSRHSRSAFWTGVSYLGAGAGSSLMPIWWTETDKSGEGRGTLPEPEQRWVDHRRHGGRSGFAAQRIRSHRCPWEKAGETREETWGRHQRAGPAPNGASWREAGVREPHTLVTESSSHAVAVTYRRGKTGCRVGLWSEGLGGEISTTVTPVSTAGACGGGRRRTLWVSFFASFVDLPGASHGS